MGQAMNGALTPPNDRITAVHPIRWDSWILADEADRRFRRICAATAAPLLALALLFTLWKLEQPAPRQEPPPPKRYVELLQPKMVAQAERKPAPQSQHPHAAARPVPAPAAPAQSAPAPSAREVAQHSGLLQLGDQLASLRNQSLSALSGQHLVSAVVANNGAASGFAANGLAGGAAATSGGIGAGAGSGVTAGQGGTALGTRRTGGVQSALAGLGGGGGVIGGSGHGASRSLAEIQEVFDRNKSPMVAIYNHSARQTPGMDSGKIVLSLLIAPDGSVTQCAIVSSSFNNAELEQKILARVRMLNFGAKNVPPFSYPNYPISFLSS